MDNEQQRDHVEEAANRRLLTEGDDPGTTAGEAPAVLVDEPAASVKRVEDSDGDVWERFDDSTWWLPGASMESRSWKYVRDSYGPLTLPGGAARAAAGEERWTQHSNELGDWCPWSAVSAPVQRTDDRCPAGCPASAVEERDDQAVTYPLERDGRVVWACCESSIGGPCGHAIGGNGLSGRDRVEVLAELVGEWVDASPMLPRGARADEALDRMSSALEQLCAPAMTAGERAGVLARIAG